MNSHFGFQQNFECPMNDYWGQFSNHFGNLVKSILISFSNLLFKFQMDNQQNNNSAQPLDPKVMLDDFLNWGCNGIDLANLKSRGGENMIHFATQKGYTVVVQTLLEKGCDVNSVDIGKRTPLHWAAFHGHTSLARILIRNGANINAEAIDKSTPLHWASGII